MVMVACLVVMATQAKARVAMEEREMTTQPERSVQWAVLLAQMTIVPSRQRQSSKAAKMATE